MLVIQIRSSGIVLAVVSVSLTLLDWLYKLVRKARNLEISHSHLKLERL